MKQPSAFPNSLLPQGLMDYLPPAAEHLARMEGVLLNHFREHGYERADPPMLEYEAGLLVGEEGGQNTHLSKQSFRLMDPVSQQMLALRTDMTGQLSRIADTRLKNAPRPLRLYYSGKILRVMGDDLQPLRQLTQIGCELFGSHSVYADAEIIALSLAGVHCLGLDHCGLDLTLPSLIPSLLAPLNLNKDKEDEIRHALSQKDAGHLYELQKGMDVKTRILFNELLGANGPIEEGIARLKKVKMDKIIQERLAPLEKIYQAVQQLIGVEIKDKNVFTLDLTDHRGFEYYRGVAFQLFAKGAGSEIGRGGRYKSVRGQEPAAGFSLYLEELAALVPSLKGFKKILVPASSAMDSLEKLQQQDYVIIRLLEAGTPVPMQAKALNCTHILSQSGEITAI